MISVSKFNKNNPYGLIMKEYQTNNSISALFVCVNKIQEKKILYVASSLLHFIYLHILKSYLLQFPIVGIWKEIECIICHMKI